jgi:histidinol phosphatase-like PHP family hydrolase/predicted phosphodiesterase
MTQSALKLLILSDVHFDSARTEGGKLKNLDPSLGAELTIRAFQDATRRHGPIDAILLCGDILHAGNDHPIDDYTTVLATLRKWIADTPLLATPGNCDLPPLFADAFNPPGLYEVGGYRFYAFADTYPDGPAECIRTDDALTEFARDTAGSDAPLVVIQHNPILPFETADIIKPPVNADAIRDAYQHANVLLSLSGHNHVGQKLTADGNVNYMTVRSLGVAPHAYTVITLTGRDIDVEERTLLDNRDAKLWDTHVHTRLAYCADADLDDTETLIARAEHFNLAGIAFAEHAPQLYVTGDDFWSAQFLLNPTIWRDRGQDRMAEYLRRVEPFRSESVKLGLEMEIDCEGFLTCHEEDLAQLDFRLGAVHWLPADTTGWTESQLQSGFLKTTDALVGAGIDVLAHPMRFLRRSKLDTPAGACHQVAQMLADTDTVCEINFHKNDPQRALIEKCLELGVKFTFGSDTHATWELGNFGANIALLAEVAGTDDIAPLLWSPW